MCNSSQYVCHKWASTWPFWHAQRTPFERVCIIMCSSAQCVCHNWASTSYTSWLNVKHITDLPLLSHLDFYIYVCCHTDGKAQLMTMLTCTENPFWTCMHHYVQYRSVRTMCTGLEEYREIVSSSSCHSETFDREKNLKFFSILF